MKPGQSPVEAVRQVRNGSKEALRSKRFHRVDEKPLLGTLSGDEYELRWDDNGSHYTFGFDTGDSMALWMVPLAASRVTKVLIYNMDFTGSFEFFLHESNYGGEVTSPACADANGWVGDWEEGTWTGGENECFSDPPLGDELWPRTGDGGFVLDMPEESHDSWLEVDLETLGLPDTVSGSFFIDAAVIKTDPESWGIGAWDQMEEPYHGFKYYHPSREWTPSGNAGWHVRSFGWDMYALVEYFEDIPPMIGPLVRSISPPRICAVITDDNPGGGPSGVAGAWFYWTIDGGEPDSLEMEASNDTLYCVDVPDILESPGSTISWWISAVDVNGNRSSTQPITYEIPFFEHPGLFVNNSMYPDWISYYYLAGVDAFGEWPHDVWNVLHFGPVSYEIFAHYETVVDVMGGGPMMCNSGLDRWLDEGDHNYITSGDEYLGRCFYGWDQDTVAIPEGDFPHDYLGLKTYYPDINYFQDGDEEGVSRILPFEGDVISGAMHEFLGDSLFLNYDPNYEIDAPNWLDGVDPVEGAAVSYRGVTGILDGEGIPQIYDTLNTAVYYELPNGSKTAFFGFDVLSLNTMAVGADTLYGAGYHWVGTYPQGPIPQALLWMNAIVLETEDSRSLPEQFALLKVYPNPFNPATTIEFSVPRGGLVTLTVYDLLGREVETILSERMDAGYHAVQWNAGDVSSGIYVVTMEAEGFRRVRKLTVLK